MNNKTAQGITYLLLTFIWKSLLVLTFLGLAIDSFRNPHTIYKVIHLDSASFLLVALVVTFFIRLFEISTLSQRVVRILSRGVFPLTLTVGIGLTFLDALTPANYVYNLTKLNYQQILYIAILSGWVVLLQAPIKWLEKHHAEILFHVSWILLVLAYIFSLFPFDVFIKMSEEDHFIENSQVIALVGGGMYACLLARRFFTKRYVFLALIFVLSGCGLLFVAGDEISWGQRLFGFTTPQSFQQNYQKETTFHNLTNFPLSITHAYLFVGLWGWSSWVLWRGLGGFLPKWSIFFISPWYLSIYFFSAFLFEARILLGPHSLGNWSEMMELMLYLGVCLYLIEQYRNFDVQVKYISSTQEPTAKKRN